MACNSSLLNKTVKNTKEMRNLCLEKQKHASEQNVNAHFLLKLNFQLDSESPVREAKTGFQWFCVKILLGRSYNI